jgi:uncharacterized protein YqeY
MLYDEIKKLNLIAMKEKNTTARAIYSVIISRIDLIKVNKREKNEELNEADCVSVVQKVLKELEDEKENYSKVNNVDRVENTLKQMEYAKALLPKCLSEEEVKEIVESLDDKSMPNIMKHFKTNYAGKCDMSIVSKIAKSYN